MNTAKFADGLGNVFIGGMFTLISGWMGNNIIIIRGVDIFPVLKYSILIMGLIFITRGFILIIEGLRFKNLVKHSNKNVRAKEEQP